MNRVSSEISIEIGMLFQNGNIYACPCQQIARHHPRGTAAYNYAARFQFVSAIHAIQFDSLTGNRMLLISMSKKNSEIREVQRRYSVGAELIGPNQTHFRIWAPKAQRLDLVLEESTEKDSDRTVHELEAEAGGY